MTDELREWRKFLLESIDRSPPKRGRPKIDISRILIMKESFRQEKIGYYDHVISIITLHDSTDGPAIAKLEVDFDKTIQEKAAAVLSSYLGGRRAKYSIGQMSDGRYALSRLGPETTISV